MEYWSRVYTEHSEQSSLLVDHRKPADWAGFSLFTGKWSWTKGGEPAEVRLALPESHANTNIIIQSANDHRAFCSTLIKPTFKSRPARRPSGSWFPLGPA